MRRLLLIIAVLELAGCAVATKIEKVDSGQQKVGERLELIPGYGDLTTVLHNQFYVIEGGKLRDIWPLTARGRLE